MKKKRSIGWFLFSLVTVAPILATAMLLYSYWRYTSSEKFFNKLEKNYIITNNELYELNGKFERISGQIEDWLLLKTSSFNIHNTLPEPPSFFDEQSKLHKLAEYWKEKERVKQLDIALENINQAHQIYLTIQELLPNRTAFKHPQNLEKANEIYAQKYYPLKKSFGKSINYLIRQNNKQLKIELSTLHEYQSAYEIYLFGMIFTWLIYTFLMFVVIRFKLLIPIYRLNKFTFQLSQEKKSDALKKSDIQELQEIAQNLNSLNNKIAKYTEFSTELGKQNFRHQLSLNSEEIGVLGNALLQTQNLIGQSNEIDEKRNWENLGLAKFSDILRQHAQSIQKIGDNSLVELIRYLKAIYGDIYLLDDENSVFKPLSCFAHDKKKFLKNEFHINEGFIGQAAAEKSMIVFKDIPEEYIKINAGLMDKIAPKFLVVMPLIANEKVYGVMELAFLNVPEEHVINFIQKVAQNIALSIFNIKSNEVNLKLLEESQALSEELQDKTKILEKQAEEMQTAQLSLQKKTKELEKNNKILDESKAEILLEQKKTEELLKNASEIIIIFSGGFNITFVSPSVKTILGCEEEELYENTDFEYIHKLDRIAFIEKLRKIANKPKTETQTFEVRILKKDGSFLYVEAHLRNMLSDPSINGILLNLIDISARIKAQQTEKKSQQFASLSYNSPDLIIRFKTDFEFLFVNPVISKYTNRTPENYLGKKIDDVGFVYSEVPIWRNLVNQAIETGENQKITKELFQNIGGRHLKLTAIPEPNEHGEIKTILVVANDISELKNAERKILDQNRELEQTQDELLKQKEEIEVFNEEVRHSIRYASRIQNAILPDIDIMQMYMPEVFVLYKPKDVVSGDFYWFVKKADKVFVAAVDCTGHGVPGAFMSLIGYTLLNQIVNEREIYDPGEILNHLHIGVRTVLKQNEEDSTSRDGMDIALLTFESNSQTVKFAGAYRPLLWFSQGELKTVRPNKFPIGGEQTEVKREFTTHSIEYLPGDSFYIFSDGYVDQFGGPKGKKFMNRRFKNLLQSLQNKPLSEQKRSLNREINTWKGNIEQTDDILVIGVRF